jgi:hypothetical protein
LTVDVETELISVAVDDGLLGGHISTRLPEGFEALLPYATLRRAPGSRYEDVNTKRLEVCRLQIDSYADDDTAAFTAIAAVLAWLCTQEGQLLVTIFVTAVDVPQTPQWAPDPDSARPHYMAHVLVYAHATAPAS